MGSECSLLSNDSTNSLLSNEHWQYMGSECSLLSNEHCQYMGSECSLLSNEH